MPCEIRACLDRQLIRDLDREIFDLTIDPKAAYDKANWWVAWDGKTPVAFAGAWMYAPHGWCFLERCGVLPSHRGHGLQKRLIKARMKWAHKWEAIGANTYTIPGNHKSANSLIACGFRMYEPERKYGGDDSLYWYRRFDSRGDEQRP